MISDEHLEELCVSGSKIPFYNYDIKQLKVKDVVEIGGENLDKIITPFALNKELFDGLDNLNIEMLDIMPRKLFDDILSMIKLIFNLNDKQVNIFESADGDLPRREIIINKDEELLFIDSLRFNELKRIILKMCNTKEFTRNELKKQQELQFEDDKMNSRFAKLFKGRDKKNKKENKALKFYNILNGVIHNQPIISYNDKLDWTIYQLYNTYKTLGIKESHDYTMRLYSSGMVSTKDTEIKTLYEKIKI